MAEKVGIQTADSEKKDSGEGVPKSSTSVPSKPSSVVPKPFVSVTHKRSTLEREARGYSQKELKSVGIDERLAKSWRIPIDERRRSVVKGNVTSLQEWLSPTKAVKPKTRIGRRSLRKTGASKKK